MARNRVYSEWEIKKLLVEIGRRVWARGYVAANDGNFSVRLSENRILTTPTGVSKGFMSTEMIVKVDAQGKVIEGSHRYKPSSELPMHLEVYRQRPDVQAVVHAHPPYATSFAVAGIPLDRCVLPEAVLTLGAVPVAPFALPSTEEVPLSIRELIRETDVILLENHGALTVGPDLQSAYFKMETLEHAAHIIWNALQLGKVNELSAENRDRLFDLREKFNIQGKILSCKK
ncbi:class II aldolase/adducin family protein [candidate division KSB1 bacterium]|nr:MAG: class II aldolase/adducin family protein [candidate division KSB1 bacterium]